MKRCVDVAPLGAGTVLLQWLVGQPSVCLWCANSLGMADGRLSPCAGAGCRLRGGGEFAGALVIGAPLLGAAPAAWGRRPAPLAGREKPPDPAAPSRARRGLAALLGDCSSMNGSRWLSPVSSKTRWTAGGPGMITSRMFWALERSASSNVACSPLESMNVRRLRSSTTHSGRPVSAPAMACRAAGEPERSHSPASSIVIVVPCSRAKISSRFGASSDCAPRFTATAHLHTVHLSCGRNRTLRRRSVRQPACRIGLKGLSPSARDR